jgi:hypothetical protein
VQRVAGRSSMKLICLHCGRALRIPTGKNPGQLPCPHCREIVRLPDPTDDAPAQEPRIAERAANWLSASAASLISLFVHLVFLLLCGFVAYGPSGGQIGEEVQIGDWSPEPLKPTPTEELDTDVVKTTPDEKSDETLAELSPSEMMAGGDAADATVFDFGIITAGDTLGDLGALRGGGGSDDQVKFMDAVATGRRFCIIADTSGSMDGDKLEYVKDEILETIASMKPTARFQVVFFSSRAIPFPAGGWLHPRRKYADLETWLKEIYASGSTNPMPAFELVFMLEPPPDAIFFMTDGLFPAQVVEKVAELQRTTRKQVVIHTISFISRDAEVHMREIARNSGGTYRHVAGI